MAGWIGKLLRIDMSSLEFSIETLSSQFLREWIGGRGFAIKLLYDELPADTNPLGPENRLVIATGPLTGYILPNSGKIVVAAKSPLTHGYGDGNLGTHFAKQLKQAGFDAIIISGVAKTPYLIEINDDKVNFVPAEEYWGQGTLTLQSQFEEKYGRSAGILTIGPAGENLVNYAVIRSLYGRAGGRPGMGAVMGSKKIKAVIVKGSHKIPASDPDTLAKLGKQAYQEIPNLEAFPIWKRQGTMVVHAWCNEHSVLPTRNFSEGVFEGADNISGDAMEPLVKKIRGCPQCNMQCGHTIQDSHDVMAELDYENVGMLGSNLSIDSLPHIGTLNRLADDLGIDTIGLGDAIAYLMEASTRGLIPKENQIKWGDAEAAIALTKKIVYREGIGDALANGVWRFAHSLGPDAETFAVHVKGLSLSAYDCHIAPGMALAFATSPVGAHHKDCWTLGWESSPEFGFLTYSENKIRKIIEFQRIRGGMFEVLVVCRFPWIELGFDLEWYPKFLKAATNEELSLNTLYNIGDKIYDLIRLFWIKHQNGTWSRDMDMPPERLFTEPLTQGPFKGEKLDKPAFNQMLSRYYELRGWDLNGVPTKETLTQHGLGVYVNDLPSSSGN